MSFEPMGSLSASSRSHHLEVAHILYMDVVGFSRLNTDVQTALVTELRDIVINTSEVRQIEQAGDLLFRPTGDGMALVFFRDSLSPARCALEIAQAIRRRPHIQMRMGIHSGPVYRFADINGNMDVSGDGIVMAQRVMDCGDAGHVLLSDTVGNWLRRLAEWTRCIDDLGDCEIKHGMHLHIFNLHTNDLGNRSLPKRLLASVSNRNLVPYRYSPSRGKFLQGVKNGFALLCWMLLSLGVMAGVLWFVPSMRAALQNRFKSQTTPATPPKDTDKIAHQQPERKPPGKPASVKSTPPPVAEHTFTGKYRVPVDAARPDDEYQIVILCLDERNREIWKHDQTQKGGDTIPIHFRYTGSNITIRIVKLDPSHQEEGDIGTRVGDYTFDPSAYCPTVLLLPSVQKRPPVPSGFHRFDAVYTVPEGAVSQRPIRILFTDAQGKRITNQEETHKNGDQIHFQFTYIGNTLDVQVWDNGNLLDEKRFNPQKSEDYPDNLQKAYLPGEQNTKPVSPSKPDGPAVDPSSEEPSDKTTSDTHEGDTPNF